MELKTESKDEESVSSHATIYIHQKAFCWYVLWRCCFYQDLADYPRLYCPVARVYATYYKLARRFDLAVQMIRPEEMGFFIQSFQNDKILCISSKQVKNEFVPCCILSGKWSFWYELLLRASIFQGCVDMVVHPNGETSAQGMSIRDMKQNVPANTLPRGHVLFSKSIQSRHSSSRAKKRSSVQWENAILPNVLVSDTVHEELHPAAVYDNMTEESESSSAYKDTNMGTKRNHDGTPVVSFQAERSVLPTEEEEVQQYITHLQRGQVGHIDPPRAGSVVHGSYSQASEDYLIQRMRLDEEFARKKKEKKDARDKSQGKDTSKPDYSIVVSKHIAHIHFILEQAAFVKEIYSIVQTTPEISEYLTLCVNEEKEKKKKKKRKKGKKKSKRSKKRATVEDTA